MPLLNPAPAIRQQWDYIVTLLRTESATGGRLNACAWTDAAGQAQTSTMLDVRRSHHLFTQQLDPTKIDPRTGCVAGVQLLPNWSTGDAGSGRRKLFTEFEIVVAATSVEQTVSGKKLQANGDDALAQAWAFLEDGAGKGLMAIFNDGLQATLGGNVNRMYVSGGSPELVMGVGATPQLWGYQSIKLKTEKPISII